MKKQEISAEFATYDQIQTMRIASYPGAGPLSYTQLKAQGGDGAFVNRVEMAMLQEANANRIQAAPPASDGSLTYQDDKLGRAIAMNPSFWAREFAPLVAEQLIGKDTLLDEAVTTDADIFSAVGAVYRKFLPAL